MHLQKLYKAQALEERNRFAEILTKDGIVGVDIDPGMIDDFVRNAHGLKVIRGRQWGTLDEDREAISMHISIASNSFVLFSDFKILQKLSWRRRTVEVPYRHISPCLRYQSFWRQVPKARHHPRNS